MKKILGFLICTLLLISCSGSFESQAKEQMEKTFKELAKDPSSVELSNVETKFSNDSICIFHLVFSGRNGFGGITSSKYEYTYLKDNINDCLREMMINLDKDESILSKSKEWYKKGLFNDGKLYKDFSEDDKKAFCIYFTASTQSIILGRKVGEKRKDRNDPDNW